MAIENRFVGIDYDKTDNKREITRLTELEEDNENTIFKLIFADTSKEKRGR